MVELFGSSAFNGIQSKCLRHSSEPGDTNLYLSTHPGDGSTSALLASMGLHKGRNTDIQTTGIHGKPREVVRMLQSLVKKGSEKFRRVIACFELHHHSADQLLFTLEHCRDLLKEGGLLLVADYGFSGLTTGEIRELVTSSREEELVRAYGGIENWARAHSTFGFHDVHHAAQNVGFSDVSTQICSGNRFVTTVSNN